jgi:hypothetical protein
VINQDFIYLKVLLEPYFCNSLNLSNRMDMQDTNLITLFLKESVVFEKSLPHRIFADYFYNKVKFCLVR